MGLRHFIGSATQAIVGGALMVAAGALVMRAAAR